MYKLVKQNGDYKSLINEYISDTLAEMATVAAPIGSTLHVLEDDKHYILDGDKDWTEYTPEGGSALPDYSEANDGDVLQIASGEPTWGAVDALPEIEETDEGKVLAVDQGEAVWADAPSGLPEIANSDEGKVLTVVDNSGTLEAEWAEPSGGITIPSFEPLVGPISLTTEASEELFVAQIPDALFYDIDQTLIVYFDGWPCVLKGGTYGFGAVASSIQTPDFSYFPFGIAVDGHSGFLITPTAETHTISVYSLDNEVVINAIKSAPIDLVNMILGLRIMSDLDLSQSDANPSQ